jgi:N-acetylglutamate synthase-like GNAT family acetyltransferase
VEGLAVRSFSPADQHAVTRLYSEGLLAGQIAPNDTGADVENIQAAYFDEDRHHFWVAEVDGQVVGMIGVASDEPHTAEIRRLRVEPSYQETEIPAVLLETALNHCKHHEYLKVRLDTRFERNQALNLFDRIGFQHTRSKNLHGKELLEFYLDLYRDPDTSRTREAE